HPHILPCLHVFEMDICLYIITPWIPNGTLGKFIAKNPGTDRLQLLYEVALAVQFLHEMQTPIIHGDIHVENVLISQTGPALLTDFGLSRIVTVSSNTYEASSYMDGSGDYHLGRAGYEAPERHDGKGRTSSTDVFAFAMLIFHTYAGVSPYGRLGTAMAVILAIHRGIRPDRADIQREDFSDSLWDLVQKCWNQEPEDRPAMAAATATLRCLL
ncbi:kinase-like protein, partial [Auricularia subglabra TFB-10046 SS5]